jgi:4-hydroxybenzoate polyprenyltransferase
MNQINNINIDDLSIPLVTDLDGSLIKIDSIFESTILCIKSNIFNIFLIPFLILKGKNHFKNFVTDHSALDPSLFPYNPEVINLLKENKAKGRRIVLSTATTENIAKSVSEHLNIFDKVIFSSRDHNNRANNKAQKLEELYGLKGYDYIGDSIADLPIFESCRKYYLINAPISLKNKAYKLNQNLIIINSDEKQNSFANIVKELRIYQWIKNILIFLPFLLAHDLQNFNSIFNNIIGFVSFSFIASFVYIINDLMDLDSDRKHDKKKNRPLASGNLNPILAFNVSLALFIIGWVLSLCFLPEKFSLLLLIYFLLTTLYSFYLKKIILIDIIVLSLLYTIRLIAGGITSNVEISKWLIAFSVFLFLSLAVIKRYQELYSLRNSKISKTEGRGYQTNDLSFLLSLGITSGYLSTLVFMLYIFSPEITRLYSKPELLLPVGLVLLLWISRMWLLTFRGEMHNDPIVFTAKDKLSYLMGLLMIVFLYLSL